MKKKIIYAILGLITIIVGCNIFTILGFINRPSIRTVSGPEATNLISATHGYIVYDAPAGGIKAVALPGLNVITIREQDKGHEPVHSVSGPDNRGRIVYVENHMGDDAKHFLKLTSIKGSEDEVIFTRKGDALWDNVIGKDLALSPLGGLAAFVGKLTPEQMYKPDSYLEVGPLEIWNIVTKSKIETEVLALDAGLTWFPDGRKLAYTKLTMRTEIPPVNSGCNVNSSFGNEWSKIPAVYIYDLSEHSSTFLHAGWHPVASTDGKSILVSGFEKNHCLVNVETRTAVPIDWPSQYGRVIAFTSSNVILHMGLPTTGVKPKWTNHNSPLVGPKPMFSIKLNDLSNSAFQTVLDYVDPRREISYGQMHD